MTKSFLDYLAEESRGRATTILKWIGAFYQETPSTNPEICTYNLTGILAEIQLLLPHIELLVDDSINELPSTQALSELELEIARLPYTDLLTIEMRPDLTGRKLMQGYLGHYPLYSALPYQPEDKALAEHYRAYKAALLVISYSLQLGAEKQALRDYRSAISRAADAVRLIADSPLLSLLPDIRLLGIVGAHEILAGQRNDDALTVSRTEKRYIEAIETLFRFYLKGTGGSLRTARRREVDISPDPTEMQPGKLTHIARVFDVSEQELITAKKSGLSLAELLSDIEYITQDDEVDPDDSYSYSPPPQTLARQAMARQHRLDAIERNAQLLPQAKNRLAPWEHAIFLRVLKNNSLQNNVSRIHIRNEALAVLAVSFWLSKRLGDILQLSIYRDESQLPKQISRGFIGYLQSTSEWVLCPLRPKAEPRYADVDKSAAIAVVQILKLPDNVGVSMYLSQLKTWERAETFGSSSAFNSPGALIEEEANAIVAQAKLLSHGRITRARIAESLYLSVFDQCGDKALASLTLSRTHRLGDTQLHYTEIRSDTLRELYAATCRSITDRSISELREFDLNPVRPQSIDNHPHPIDQSIGCPIRPSEDSIAKLANELAIAIEQLRSGTVTTDFALQFHNLYTIYIIQQLQHLTGLRAVKTPIPSLDCIDFENNLLLASDKDDYTSFNTRIVPLTKVGIIQLKYYLSHRRTLLSRLAIFDPTLAKNLNLDSPESKHRPNGALFFFLNLDGEKIKFSAPAPSIVQEEVRRFAPWFGLPDNCQRSRIRSRLLEQNCPPQWIDALLGHWTRGEEPWHRFASTSLKRMCDGVRDHLETIARDDGWRALRGLG